MKKTLVNLLIAFISCLIASCGKKLPTNHLIIKTLYGDIEVVVYPDKAPLTVAAFLSFVDSGIYNQSSFYRVLNEDNQPTGANSTRLIQGGVYATPKGNTLFKSTPHEGTLTSGLSHLHGTLSMARQAPGTASTEFFICIGDQPGFDEGGSNNPDKAGYAAFGRVINGMDVVMQIYNCTATDQRFTPSVPIRKIVR